jgi:hypothetical protein
MSFPPLPPTSAHKIFCEYCNFMSNLPRWYEEEFVKCIILNVDWTIKRTERLQYLNKLNLLYGDHKKILFPIQKKIYHHPIFLRGLETLILNSLF